MQDVKREISQAIKHFLFINEFLIKTQLMGGFEFREILKAYE